MKKAIAIALLIISVSSFAQTSKPFTIKGTLKNFSVPVEKVYLSYRADGVTVRDSSIPKDGAYMFKGNITEPVVAQMAAKPASPSAKGIMMKRDVATVFISPSNIVTTSTDSFSNIVIKGSAAQDEYAKVQTQLKPIEDKGNELNKQYMEFAKAKDEAGQKKIVAEFDDLDKQSKEVYKGYIQKNPSSPINMYLLNQFAGYDIKAEEVDPLFNALPASAKDLPSYKDLDKRLAIARKTSVGKPAMDFTQNDTLGKPVSLSSFKGKYVLVDFWASWCGPCRRENPNVVTAFNKYKDKGFTVLGVSLDQPGKEANWIKAIHDDKLTWTHVSDLKFWNNDVAVLYGVRAIPFNLLLDKDGKIVAKNIRGDELQNKLATLMQ